MWLFHFSHLRERLGVINRSEMVFFTLTQTVCVFVIVSVPCFVTNFRRIFCHKVKYFLLLVTDLRAADLRPASRPTQWIPGHSVTLTTRPFIVLGSRRVRAIPLAPIFGCLNCNGTAFAFFIVFFFANASVTFCHSANLVFMVSLDKPLLLLLAVMNYPFSLYRVRKTALEICPWYRVFNVYWPM